MLYKIHDDVTQENLEKMKFLLDEKLGRGQTEKCEVWRYIKNISTNLAN